MILLNSNFKLYYMIERREDILKQVKGCVDYVAANCFYCKNCWYCLVTKKLQKEADKKGLKTSDIQWWSIKWSTDKKGNNIPQLVSHKKSLW